MPGLHGQYSSLEQRDSPAGPASHATAQSPIIVVDQNTGFNATAGMDTADGVHPNASGSTKIATNWVKALEAYYPVF